MLLNSVVCDTLNSLTREVIHSGLVLLSIDLEIRGINGYFSLRSAPKLHLLIPRIGYLICIFDSIQDYYNSFDTRFSNLAEKNLCWFEYNGFTINSEYPVGLVFDIYNKHGMSLPLKFIVSLISETKHKIGEINNIRNDFTKKITNDIKLSQTLILGDCRKLQMLSKKEYKNLISSIYSLSMTTEKYEYIYERIFGKTREIYENTRNIPVKLYIKNRAFLKSFTRNTNNGPLRIKDVLSEIVSDLHEKIDSLFIVFHGIKIPIETPLIYLLTSCSYIDGIVHLVIRT